jgi:hypothetical protein
MGMTNLVDIIRQMVYIYIVSREQQSRESKMKKYQTIKVDAKQYEDYDILKVAAEDYVDEHPEAEGYDLDARWEGGDDGEREVILLDVPAIPALQVERIEAEYSNVRYDTDIGDIRFSVDVANSRKEGEEAYEASCDVAEESVRALLLPGYTFRWAGSGNTDSDGSCTEDVIVEHI